MFSVTDVNWLPVLLHGSNFLSISFLFTCHVHDWGICVVYRPSLVIWIALGGALVERLM